MKRTCASLVLLVSLPGACGGGGTTATDAARAPDDTAAPLDTALTSDAAAPTPFSFFVASMAAMQKLSGNANGFGGDLRFGQADGLSGADEICRRIAETSLAGSGAKGWRAFLSVTKSADGKPVNAIDRVGSGPWYDRLGRVVAVSKEDLAQARPRGADPVIVNDLPNENGVPNHAPDGQAVDNHDVLTGSNDKGELISPDWSHTCHDWTSAVGSDGQPRVGHSWPRAGGPGGFGPPPRLGDGGPGAPPGAFDGGQGIVGPPVGGPGGTGDPNNWMSSLDEAGCAAGINIVDTGPPIPSNPSVGSGGGYGGIYCFALQP
jgi:hypothetical protein